MSMSSTAPKFRKDLVISPVKGPEGTQYVIKDPVTGAFFHLREAEHFIARQCDGRTSLEDLRGKVEKEFEAALPMEVLKGFIAKLRSSGLLESSRPRRAKQKQRFQGTLLYFRFKLFDPDALFNRLEQKVRFCFTPWFVALSALVILISVGVTARHADEAVQHLGRLYHLSAVPVLVVTIFAVVGAHEFAHGLTCKHFGGEVHEIGGMLIYFQPALYVNVSDAWLFPEKTKRLWVAFAGPYFELFLWGLATLVWRVTDVQTWLNYLAFVVMASSGIKTLVNFNPLVKLDGYYLLSDYLEIPNLRRRSFLYIGNLLRRVAGLQIETPVTPTERERKVFLAYGLAATVCSFSLLLFFSFQAGSLLIAQHQPISFGLLVGLFGVKFQQRVRRLMSKSGGFDEGEEEPTPEKEGARMKTTELPASNGAAKPATEPRNGLVALARKIGDTIAGWYQVPAEICLVKRVTVGPVEPQTKAGIASARAHSNPSPAKNKPKAEKAATATHGPVVTLAGTGTRTASQGEARVTQVTAKPREEAPKRRGKESVFARVVRKLSPKRDHDGHVTSRTPAERAESKPGIEVAPAESPAPGPAKDKKTASRKRRAWLRRAQWFVLLAGLAGLMIFGKMELRIAGEFEALPIPHAEARARVEGMVAEILVEEGQKVKRGDVLARLSGHELKADLAKTLAQREEARARLKMLEAGPTTEEIEVARAAVQKAEDTVRYAQGRLKRDKGLFEEKLVSMKDYEDVEELATSASNALRDAKSRLSLLQRGARAEEIAAVKAEVARYDAQRAYLEEQAELLEIRSLADGVIVTPTRQLKELKHQVVKKGEPVARVDELEWLRAEMVIPEKEIADVKPGQKVIVKARAYPGRPFHGVVKSIGMATQGSAEGTGAGASLAGRTVLVTTEIDNRSLLLKPGMTGQAKIYCGEQRLYELATRRISRTVKVEFWSWW